MAESENRRSDEGRSGADRSGPPARSRSLLVAVLLSIAGFTLLLIGMTTANASLSSRAVAQPTDNVTLCHRTASHSNPYVVITVDPAGAYNGHYLEHTGPIFPATGSDGKWGDIIPPFMFQGQTYSRNWDAEGMAIFENGCKIPAPTTSPVTTPSTPESTPTTPVTTPTTPTTPVTTPTTPVTTPTTPVTTPTTPVTTPTTPTTPVTTPSTPKTTPTTPATTVTTSPPAPSSSAGTTPPVTAGSSTSPFVPGPGATGDTPPSSGFPLKQVLIGSGLGLLAIASILFLRPLRQRGAHT